MLELTISENNGKHVLLKDKLENLSVSQKVILMPNLEEPFLKEGKKVYSGFEDIFNFLETEEVFVKQWYECRCGNHESMA
ncbi:MAG: hypothetical protein M3512_13655 [Bacteroidota bacterium]|nr:hypothetical protein [Bacteroidota bacterium]